jgi:hypothetical protein
MKTLHALSIILMAVMVFAISSTTNAQDFTFKKKSLGDSKNGSLLYAATDVDSLHTVSSDWISTADFDNNSFLTYPPAVGIKLISASALPHITATIEASFDGENVACVYDTLGAVGDSTETLQTTTFTTFNTVKYPYYRLTLKGEAHNRVDAYAEFWIYYYKKY